MSVIPSITPTQPLSSIQVERAGIESLLLRLQIDLSIQFHPLLPQLAADIVFTAEWGFCRYHRLQTGEMWIEDLQSPVAIQVHPQNQQLVIYGTSESAATRHLWHGLIRYGVAAYLCDRNYTPMHAAALIDPSGFTWLIAGQTHAGKSTLVVGLLESGWQYLSDDSLILAVENDEILAHAWLGTSLIDPILTQTYPHLLPELGDLVCDRRLIQLQRCYPTQWVAQSKPQGILFPCISPETQLADLESLSPGTALAQLMAHSAPWLMEYPQNHLLKLQKLCQQCRYETLLLGSTLRTQPHLVVQTLAL